MKQKFPGKLRTLGLKKIKRQKGHGSPAGFGKWRRTEEGLSEDGGGRREHFLTHENVQVQAGVFQIQFQKLLY